MTPAVYKRRIALHFQRRKRGVKRRKMDGHPCSKFKSFVWTGLSVVVCFVLSISLWDLIFFTWNQNSNMCFLKCLIPTSSLTPWIPWGKDAILSPTTCFVNNVLLLLLFMCFHSVKPPNVVKYFIPEFISRLVYILFTSLAIEILIYGWRTTPAITIWRINIENNDIMWWIFAAISLSSWVFIYIECLTMDLAELVGIKQVYYHSVGMGSPLERKTEKLQKCFDHMRHPGLTAFSIILWCHPLMTLDRFLIASVLSLFMWLKFPVTDDDYQYQIRQMQTKANELKAPH